MVAVAVAFAERRSDFVAAVSHELKTPLTAIRMYGEMLRDGIVPSDAKRQEYYRHITAESERLSRLINNVLEFARLEKGTRDVALTTGAVEPVVREAVELVRPHVEAEGFALRLESDGALPPVRFERDALLQVLFNLIDNAVKYARDGTERWVLVRTAAADGGVRLAVRDSGPGVPARHLAHVFEPFYRGERELTRRHKGTGLGLALVRGLVERMGGHVRGRNVDGGGFEVTIDFPSSRG
jgi:two-component system, OmpR family, sensor histidine kinase VicK